MNERELRLKYDDMVSSLNATICSAGLLFASLTIMLSWGNVPGLKRMLCLMIIGFISSLYCIIMSAILKTKYFNRLIKLYKK